MVPISISEDLGIICRQTYSGSTASVAPSAAAEVMCLMAWAWLYSGSRFCTLPIRVGSFYCREVPVDSFSYDGAGKKGRLTLICHCITATRCTGAMIND